MTVVHGIASAVVPGLGQVLGGETKEGVKQMATNYVAAPAIVGAGAGLVALTADCVTLTENNKLAVKEGVSKAGKIIGKHPKLALIAGAALALGGAALSVVNYIKSVAGAAKIDKK